MNIYAGLLLFAFLGLILVELWCMPPAVKARIGAVRRRMEYFIKDGRPNDAEMFLLQCEFLHLIPSKDGAELRADLMGPVP